MLNSEMSIKAIKHYEYCAINYSNEIINSIINTTTYIGDEQGNIDNINNITSFYDTKFIFLDSFTQDVVVKYQDRENIAILNFSDFTLPAGKFFKGSTVQEESLCHNSILANVLYHFDKTFYNENKKFKNGGYYANRALYSKDVLFINSDKPVYVDVITCAAPNLNYVRRFNKAHIELNNDILDSRIKFILNIAKDNNVKTLVLGAYGCGIFGQDAKLVSETFKKYLLNEFQNVFKEVLFALPKGKNTYNYNTFKEVIDTMI